MRPLSSTMPPSSPSSSSSSAISKRHLVNASRRVANMTPAQIESKRSIDRANQRYCRAKRKTQMEALQGQVDALTRELEDAQRELRGYKEREEMRREEEESSEGSGVTFASGSWTPSGNELVVAGEGQLQTSVFDQNMFGDALDSSPYYQPVMTYSDINVNLLDSTWPSGSGPMSPQPIFPRSLSPGPPSRPLPWTGHFNLDRFDPPFTTTASAEWKLIPPLIAATTQLDQVILGTTETLRLRGFKPPRKESQFPSISSLLNPAAQDPSSSSSSSSSSKDDDEPCSISTAAAAQVGRSPVASLLARVGFMYVLSHLLRWYICRTKESYDRLPAFIRPTLLQRTIPHPPWIDVIVWPDVRDAIIQHMDWSRFFELRAATAKSLCVGWPDRDLRSVFDVVDGRQGYRLTGRFEEHLRNEQNWTVGADAQDVFPFLKPVCRATL